MQVQTLVIELEAENEGEDDEPRQELGESKGFAVAKWHTAHVVRNQLSFQVISSIDLE